jgi:hypothetical protein
LNSRAADRADSTWCERWSGESSTALRRLVSRGYRKPFGRFEHLLTFVKRRFLEWRQNNGDFAQAKRNAMFHDGVPIEFFHLVLGDTYAYSNGFWKADTRTLDEAPHDDFVGSWPTSLPATIGSSR